MSALVEFQINSLNQHSEMAGDCQDCHVYCSIRLAYIYLLRRGVDNGQLRG